MVCRARQQHVESTLKAQQLITCMSNIPGIPRNLSAPCYCSCRTSNLQTTSDAQNILNKGCGSIFLSPPGRRQALFCSKTLLYYFFFHHKKVLLHLYHSMGLSGIPVCILCINTVFSPTQSAQWREGWKVQLMYMSVSVCVFDYLWQADTGRTIVKKKRKKTVVKWIVGQNTCKGKVKVSTSKTCTAEQVSNICKVKKNSAICI